MSNLKQVVEGLDAVWVEAVGMFQVQAAVFLDVESLIFDFVSLPSSLVSDSGDAILVDFKISDPCEGVFLCGGGFLA